jgi:diguanylate cyclase (GGDEF)-like protein
VRERSPISLRASWRLGGALLIAAALPAVPFPLLLDEVTDAWLYAVSAVGLLIGLILLNGPWQWLDQRWLAAVPVLAVIQIGLEVAAGTDELSWLYLLVAIYVALVFPHLPELALFLGLIVGALLLPIAYDAGPTEETAIWALTVGPAAAFTGVAVARLTIGLHTSREAYRKLSAVDGLTGVGNYRALIQRLDHEVSRHSRRHRSFALLSLDLDGFKGINETQGHLLGDTVLAIVGNLIEAQVRSEDGVYRQGGDEFSVVAPETGPVEANLLVRRIGASLEGVTSGPVRVSATIGSAVFPRDGTEVGQLLDAADRDLRSQKVAQAVRPA